MDLLDIIWRVAGIAVPLVALLVLWFSTHNKAADERAKLRERVTVLETQVAEHKDRSNARLKRIEEKVDTLIAKG